MKIKTCAVKAAIVFSTLIFLVMSAYAEGALNVKDVAYGAIGDDQHHLLSSQYATLADAQVKYPCATALSDEIDWCAIQTAVDALPPSPFFVSGTAKGGGCVYIPEGSYRLNRSITLRNAVELRGCNRSATRLVFEGVAGGIQALPNSGETGVVGICVNNLAIEGADTNECSYGLLLSGVGRSWFYELTIRVCTIGIRDDLCVSNKFDNLVIQECDTGICVIGSTGAMNTTQWFKNIYITYCTGSGIYLNGSEHGVQGMTFDNIICERCNLGIVVSGGTNPAITYGNSFKNLWLEQNTIYAFQIVSGYQTFLENVYSDNTAPVILNSANETTLKDIHAPVVIEAGSGIRYFEGTFTGSLTDADVTKSRGRVTTAIPNTTGKNLANVEIELNKVKQALRNYGVITP